jgi:hypothetical protein
MKFREYCWRGRRYRVHNFLESAVKDKEYFFRGLNLGNVAVAWPFRLFNNNIIIKNVIGCQQFLYPQLDY